MKLKTITIICSSIVAIVSVIFCYLITIAVCSYHSDERADLLELRYADLKRDYNFINQSYQDILAVVYDKDPDLIEKLIERGDIYGAQECDIEIYFSDNRKDQSEHRLAHFPRPGA